MYSKCELRYTQYRSIYTEFFQTMDTLHNISELMAMRYCILSILSTAPKLIFGSVHDVPIQYTSTYGY